MNVSFRAVVVAAALICLVLIGLLCVEQWSTLSTLKKVGSFTIAMGVAATAILAALLHGDSDEY